MLSRHRLWGMPIRTVCGLYKSLDCFANLYRMPSGAMVELKNEQER
jgi:hypothetical protein